MEPPDTDRRSPSPGLVSSPLVPDAARLEALAEFAAGAGHEINNPVATISGRVELLLRTETDPERRQALLTIGGQALRIRDMIGDVMLFARPPRPAPEPLDLAEAVAEVAARFAERAVACECTIGLKADGAVPIHADRTQLAVVIAALLDNALHAQPAGGEIEVSAHASTENGVRCARLAIADRGPGLTEKDRIHLFDPFYSGRQAGRGLGFGLPKAWRIVSNHGGRIDVHSLPGGGTVVDVSWPAEGQPDAPPSC